MIRNLLARVGVKSVGTGSRRVKQLTCMLEYTQNPGSPHTHDEVQRIRDFKQKFGLTDKQFMELSNILGTDHATLSHLGGEQVPQLVEKKLREFGIYPRGSIAGRQI